MQQSCVAASIIYFPLRIVRRLISPLSFTPIPSAALRRYWLAKPTAFLAILRASEISEFEVLLLILASSYQSHLK